MRFRRTRKEQNRNVVVVGQFCGIYSYFHTSCLGVADIHTRVGLRVLRHSSGQHHEFAVRSLLKGFTDLFILVIWMQNYTASYIYLAKATANRPSVGFYRRGWLQRWGKGGGYRCDCRRRGRHGIASHQRWIGWVSRTGKLLVILSKLWPYCRDKRLLFYEHDQDDSNICNTCTTTL